MRLGQAQRGTRKSSTGRDGEMNRKRCRSSRQRDRRGHHIHLQNPSPQSTQYIECICNIHPQTKLLRISLWYHRIPSRDRAIGQTQTKVMYPLTDQGDHLRGKYFNLTSHWHVMPKVGRMIADEIVMPAIFSLPKDIVNV
ncbi:signal peptidase complex subunit 3A-like [Amborella trichopoda]|uniref:signal peptidase complex subunit 3A-like n=1 Tax=Amborella trichopoda TaxID=13333 RepID=UPI0009BEEAB9|nr:signal peptidase complex subunit 3A-like [Amborella trichopoda]|eukprot:XP_020523333.1 signal peptidase complex subunit 3A-like [Amborella trichopoda]